MILYETKGLKYASGNDFLNTTKAAAELGIKESAVRNYLPTGKFTIFKFKNLTLLDINEVREWKQTRSKH